MSKTDFHNGGCGSHLGFPIGMILAHFDPEALMLLQNKFQLKSTKRVDEIGFKEIWLGDLVFDLATSIFNPDQDII